MARILVVDDDHSAVTAVTRMLSGDGHDVAAFTEGAAAVEALSRESFDAVMTDLDMPEVDGHMVVRSARQHAPEACVVVVTARAQESEGTLTDAGACLVTDKPLAYDAVMKTITDCRTHGGPGGHGRCHMRSRTRGSALVALHRK